MNQGQTTTNNYTKERKNYLHGYSDGLLNTGERFDDVDYKKGFEDALKDKQELHIQK